jgi:hypothetical protein
MEAEFKMSTAVNEMNNRITITETNYSLHMFAFLFNIRIFKIRFETGMGNKNCIIVFLSN